MAEQQTVFKADFIYTDAILKDFESLYRAKQHLSPSARILCGLVGVAGSVYFAWQLYKNGLNLAHIGYLLLCSVMILLAFSTGRSSGTDDTLKKYRKHYLNRRVQFLMDENGIQMKLEKQKNSAKSKFREIYGIFETKQCFYFVIKGKAYYIVSKAAVTGGDADDFRRYMETHCNKKAQFFELEKQSKNK